MKLLNKFAIAAIAALSMSSLSAQAASVWKVTNGKNVTYFGGTVHILKPENFPLPAEFDKAYAASDKLVFETDIEGLESPAFQQRMVSQVMLNDGTTLQTRLNDETYARLKAYMDERGMPITNFHPLKPSMVALTVTVMEYQANGLTQEGVDKFYAVKAKEDGKAIEWFESTDQQLNFIVNMGGDDENALINYTLDEVKNLPSMIDTMLSTWKSGDLTGMDESMVAPMAADFPQVHKDLLVDRNNNWMPKVVEMLNDAPTEFVLVGAAHLAGKDSVFAMLEAKGYKVEKL
ncbi:TraB/GumN family protein [Glaciecola sp. MH2013]|uniref:TraB/GumN family protein n=1 Tax=Glaciecola sp. MH2013 TaxID=2785524 RepID=UPI0018A10C95|nr:TraB/GumN family protein [Glaciecola sp. MH2013]MBF7071825.1 TraB/GumN family protein [Glaciecola sp. MH2013]